MVPVTWHFSHYLRNRIRIWSLRFDQSTRPVRLGSARLKNKFDEKSSVRRESGTIVLLRKRRAFWYHFWPYISTTAEVRETLFFHRLCTKVTCQESLARILDSLITKLVNTHWSSTRATPLESHRSGEHSRTTFILVASLQRKLGKGFCPSLWISTLEFQKWYHERERILGSIVVVVRF